MCVFKWVCCFRGRVLSSHETFVISLSCCELPRLSLRFVPHSRTCVICFKKLLSSSERQQKFTTVVSFIPDFVSELVFIVTGAELRMC